MSEIIDVAATSVAITLFGIAIGFGFLIVQG